MEPLRRQRALQERARVRVDELGIDKVGVAIAVRRDVPLALNVLAEQRASFLIAQTPRRLVLHPNVVLAFRAALETHTHDRAFGIKKTRGLAPEKARLKGVSAPTNRNRLGHEFLTSPSWNGGVGIISRAISTARAGFTGPPG